jgi:hypothetical protein
MMLYLLRWLSGTLPISQQSPDYRRWQQEMQTCLKH